MNDRALSRLVHLTSALPDARVLRLPTARGHWITCVSGQVWISQQGHSQDRILHAGDALRLDSPGSALVRALGSAEIELTPPPAPENLVSAWSDAVGNVEHYEGIARRLRAEAFRDAVHGTRRALCRLGARIAAALGSVSPKDRCSGTA